MNNASKKVILSISTDRKIFEEGSAVRARQIEYAKQCEEMHIIVFAGREFTEQSIAPNCFIYPTRSRSKFMYPLSAAKLGKFIAHRRGITNITCQDPSFTAMAGISIKRSIEKLVGRDLPLEIQVHTDIGSPNFAFNITNKVRKAMALSYLKQADHIRVVSNRIKKYLVETLGIDTAKIEVRPIVVDTAAVKSAPILEGSDLHKKYPQFAKIVLMASRLTVEKNIPLALHAWPEVIAKNPNAGLIIVGTGPLERELKSLAGKLDANSSVIFESWMDEKILYSYYKTADLFLNTSLFEGYGMTLVEASAAGCKIVSTDVGVASEVGAVISPFDSHVLAEVILKTI